MSLPLNVSLTLFVTPYNDFRRYMFTKLQLLSLTKWFRSKFQAFVTIFNCIMMLGFRINQPFITKVRIGMTILVNLLLRSVIRKLTTVT